MERNLACLNDSGKFSPRNDQSLRDMLHIFVSKNNLKFTVFIETPSKSFSDWSFRRCVSFMVLANQTISHYQCSRLSLARLKSIPISENEASKSSYLVAE
ncbi:unnamed protein product [Rhizophagus irregularis]|nr:unnamed protein product [Rhizophagus irregularis]